MSEEQKISKNEQERQTRLKAATGRKVKKYIIWAVAAAAVIGGIVWVVDYSKKTEQNRPGEEVSELGRDHILPGEEADYNSNPPTSGSHYAAAPDWGVYEEEIPDGAAIHSLEHGGIWISYKDADEETKSKIEALGREYPGSVVVSPRAANDAPIAVASWGRLMKLDSFDEELIRDYIKANRNKSPEPLAR